MKLPKLAVVPKYGSLTRIISVSQQRLNRLKFFAKLRLKNIMIYLNTFKKSASIRLQKRLTCESRKYDNFQLLYRSLNTIKYGYFQNRYEILTPTVRYFGIPNTYLLYLLCWSTYLGFLTGIPNTNF